MKIMVPSCLTKIILKKSLANPANNSEEKKEKSGFNFEEAFNKMWSASWAIC